MKQWNIKIFIENEIKNSRRQIVVLVTELILIILLASVFTVGFIIFSEWNWVFLVVLFVFFTIILLGVYNWYDKVRYLNQVKQFKAYIDEVYKQKNVKTN